MNKQSKGLYYFKTSFNLLCTNQLIISLLLIIDYLDIFSFLITCISKLRHTNITIPYDESTSFTYYINIFNLIKVLTISDPNAYVFLLLISSIIFLIWYYLHIFFIKCINIDNSLFKLYCKIHVNLYDHIVYRLLFLYLIDGSITFIVGSIMYSLEFDPNGNLLIYFELIIGIIIFMLLLFSAYFHIKNHCVLTTFKFFQKKKSNYPFDIHITYPFDSVLLLIKSFISIEKNVFLFTGKFINSRVILFNTLGLVIFIMYYVYLFYSLYINRELSLFYPSTISSTLRLLLSNVTACCIIIHFLLPNSFMYLSLFLDCFCCYLFLIYYFKFFRKIVLNRFYNSNNLIAVLFYLISFDSLEISIERYICNWFTNHKLNCSKQECIMCYILDRKLKQENSQLLQFKNFFHFILECIKTDMQKHKAKYSKGNEMYIDIFEFIDLYLLENNQRIQFYILAYSKMMKYQTHLKVVQYNLSLMFEVVNELNADFIRSYNNFNNSEEILKIYKEFFNDVDNFVRYDSKAYLNLVKFSNTLYKFIYNKKVLTYLNKNTNNYSYEVLLLKYLYETITNKIINNHSLQFDISQFTDFLSFHWENDKFMLINYGLLGKDCTIVRSSNSTKKMNGAPFESLFPKYLRSKGKDLLVKELYTNNFDDQNNLIEFIINSQNQSNSYFIESFKMKFMMYPSINTGEMLIRGNYNYKYVDVILFEIIDEKEALISFSENMKNIFNITPSIVEELRLNQKVFEFKQLFLKKVFTCTIIDNTPLKTFQSTMNKQITQPTIPKPSNETVYYVFNYDYYYNLLECYFNEMNNENKNKESILKELSKNKNSIIELTFKIKKEIFIETKSTQYNAYFINIKKDNKDTMTDRHFETLAKAEIVADFQLGKETSQYFSQTEGATKTQYNIPDSGESVISNSSTPETGINKLNIKLTEKDKKDEKEKKTMKKITSYISILIIVHIITILTAIFYLIVQVIQSRSLYNLFNLFQNFKFLKRGIDIDLLRISSNFCFSPSIDSDMINDNRCSNFFYEYSKNMQKQHELISNDALINEVVNMEFKANVNAIKEKYNAFIKGLYKLDKKYILQIESKEVMLLSLNLDELGRRIIQKRKESFFAGINTVFNFFIELIDKDVVIKTPMKFITLTYNNETEHFGIEYTNLDKISMPQQTLYSTILNFPFITKLLLVTQNDIRNWFNNHLLDLKYSAILFSLALLIFSIGLLIAKILFVIYFSKKLEIKLYKIHKRLFTPMFINFFLRRNAIEQEMLELYESHPILLANKINNEIETYKKQIQEIKKSKVKLSAGVKKKLNKKYTFQPRNNSNSSLNNGTDINTKKVFNVYYIFIVVTYIIFIIVFAILFAIITNGMSKLNDLVDYSNLNAEIDNNLNTNLNSLQFMIVTNTTDNQIGGFINDNFSLYFISEGINNHLHAIKIIENIKAKYPDLFRMDITKENVTCDEYPSLNDSEFQRIIEPGQEDVYYEFLIDMCKSFTIMRYNNPILLMENIIYYEQKIINNMLLAPYHLKYLALKMPDIYQLFSLILILNRIQRTFLNEQTLPNLILTIIKEYKNKVIICLIINIFLLLLVATITIVFVTKQLTVINKKLNVMMKFFNSD